jgi:NADPH:quinone reductase-like Zn-dependent oxidoreductase
MIASGVNPTDWKSRRRAFGRTAGEPTVPNHDGAGIVDAVAPGVTGIEPGDRVWVTLAATGARQAGPRRNTRSCQPNVSSRWRRARASSSARASGSQA